LIGYGAMLLESFVGVMAMVRRCAMQPGVYFAINSPAGVVGATPDAGAATISGWGYRLDPQTMINMAHAVGEQTLFNRAGGAPSLAVGMAQIFSKHDRRRPVDEHLVSLRDHVRGAFYFDGAGRRTRVGSSWCRRWAGACGNRSAKRAGCRAW